MTPKIQEINLVLALVVVAALLLLGCTQTQPNLPPLPPDNGGVSTPTLPAATVNGDVPPLPPEGTVSADNSPPLPPGENPSAAPSAAASAPANPATPNPNEDVPTLPPS